MSRTRTCGSILSKQGDRFSLTRARQTIDGTRSRRFSVKRPRPERGAKPPSESERGWGPASVEKVSLV